ncbi:hypothetical protein B0H13DRAFT_1926194 [Mycena leptocephala]|nr:hypothetical protein B0H13DRAFT_1926194 [Mycena leptocephala]
MFGQLCLYFFFLPPLTCFPLLLPFKGIHNGGNKIRPPAAMDTSESMSPNSGKQLNNWPLLVGLVLLLYDYLLTLPTEIRIVWPRPRPWLLLIRYLALGTNLTMVVLTFGIFGLQWNRWISILTLHVYALFNRKRIILWLLSLTGLGSLSIGVWLGSAADTAASLPGSIAGAWEAELTHHMVFRDLLIFAFTFLCGILHWRRGNYRSRLVKCFVLDAAVDVANILSYYDHSRISSAIKPFLAGSLAWLASALSAVLTARLILNMREVADTDSMAVGDVVSVEVSTVEWNDIDGIPMEATRGHDILGNLALSKNYQDSRYPSTIHQDFGSFSWDILEIVYFNTKVGLFWRSRQEVSDQPDQNTNLFDNPPQKKGEKPACNLLKGLWKPSDHPVWGVQHSEITFWSQAKEFAPKTALLMKYASVGYPTPDQKR